MKPITCVCGKGFYKRTSDRRCPHCNILIVLPNDSPGYPRIFFTIELERGNVAVVSSTAIDPTRTASHFYYDASKQGPARWGWKGWPVNLTLNEIWQLKQLQAQNPKCEVHGCTQVAAADEFFCVDHCNEETEQLRKFNEVDHAPANNDAMLNATAERMYGELPF